MENVNCKTEEVKPYQNLQARTLRPTKANDKRGNDSENASYTRETQENRNGHKRLHETRKRQGNSCGLRFARKQNTRQEPSLKENNKHP